MEEKDRLQELGIKEFEDQGKMVGLMLQMSRKFVEHGKSGDNGQWVFSFKRNFGIDRKGAFRQALVKPRGKGRPVLIPSKYIDEHFNSKTLSHCETLEQVLDGIKFLFHCQKEENYVTKIMSCHGVLTPLDDHDTFRDTTNADGSRLRIQFKYPEPISCHNQPKHWVDDSNNCRHDPIALSDVWRTK